MPLKFTIEKKDGKWDINKELLNTYLSKLNNGKYLLEVKKYFKKRSNSQNKYYWKCIQIIGDELGYERDEMHETFKATFLSREENELKHVPSSANITTKEFSGYMERIIRFAAKQGIVLPDPTDAHG